MKVLEQMYSEITDIICDNNAFTLAYKSGHKLNEAQTALLSEFYENITDDIRSKFFSYIETLLNEAQITYNIPPSLFYQEAKIVDFEKLGSYAIKTLVCINEAESSFEKIKTIVRKIVEDEISVPIIVSVCLYQKHYTYYESDIFDIFSDLMSPYNSNLQCLFDDTYNIVIVETKNIVHKEIEKLYDKYYGVANSVLQYFDFLDLNIPDKDTFEEKIEKLLPKHYYKLPDNPKVKIRSKEKSSNILKKLKADFDKQMLPSVLSLNDDIDIDYRTLIKYMETTTKFFGLCKIDYNTFPVSLKEDLIKISQNIYLCKVSSKTNDILSLCSNAEIFEWFQELYNIYLKIYILISTSEEEFWNTIQTSLNSDNGYQMLLYGIVYRNYKKDFPLSKEKIINTLKKIK